MGPCWAAVVEGGMIGDADDESDTDGGVVFVVVVVVVDCCKGRRGEGLKMPGWCAQSLPGKMNIGLLDSLAGFRGELVERQSAVIWPTALLGQLSG